MNNLYLTLGAMLGANLRWFLSTLAIFDEYYLSINALGSFMAGFLFESYLSSSLNYFFIIGFCGSFTTFSSFSLKSIEILKESYAFGFFYIALMLLANLSLCYWGMKFGSFLNWK